jgi:chloramphenicol-sensitive protein RarD
VPQRDETRAGLIFGAAAYLMWGLFPLFWPLLQPASTLEILAQRMAWSLVVVAVILACTGGFTGVRRVLGNPRQRALLAAAAVLVSVNWGTYIYGVNTHRVVETSLGYFINPIFTILLGVIVLGERLRWAQWISVGIGGAAVIVIAVDYGQPPWIALTLATSFGLYGFCKKKAGVSAVDSLAVETMVMFVPAVVTIAVIGSQGNLAFGHVSVGNSLLLASSGLVTAIPLLLFAGATQRLPLSVLGLLQYLAPVLQFAVGVGIRHESVPLAEYVGFGLVWIALILLGIDGLRAQRAPSSRAAPLEAAPVT